MSEPLTTLKRAMKTLSDNIRRRQGAEQVREGIQRAMQDLQTVHMALHATGSGCPECGWSRGHDYGCPRDPLNPGHVATHPLAAAVPQPEAGEPVAWLTVCGPTTGCGVQYVGNLAHCPNCGKVNFGRPVGATVIVSAAPSPVAQAPAQAGEAAVLAAEARSYALCIFGDGDVRSDLRELNDRIDLLAALATPQVSPPQARVPLTEEQIIRLTAELDCDRPGWAIRWARAVERAHLIGLETKGDGNG